MTITLPSDIPVNANAEYRSGKPIFFHVPLLSEVGAGGAVSIETFARRGWTVTNVNENRFDGGWTFTCR